MQLKAFRIQNYRSINDSGLVKISKLTALIGRNESGKSNLLRALYSLNPAEDVKTLEKYKDLPRHQGRREIDNITPVVTSVWELSKDEKTQLQKNFSRTEQVTLVIITRKYGETINIEFPGLSNQNYDKETVTREIQNIISTIKIIMKSLDDSMRLLFEKIVSDFQGLIKSFDNAASWAQSANVLISVLQEASRNLDQGMKKELENSWWGVKEISNAIINNEKKFKKANLWVEKNIPKFIFIDQYPQLNGTQNIKEYLARVKAGQDTEEDKNFGKMCKVSGLDPKEIQNLLKGNKSGERNQLAKDASASITKEIRRLWEDRQLTIRFNVDGECIDTLISDSNDDYDFEINLNERSRGFLWFFSFYVTFAADTSDGDASKAILLLDEPGLHLHATAQRDLLNHFEKDFNNQVIYTTHSPFMVPTDNLDAIRTVNLSETSETSVSNDLTGDSKTLFPLQAALGYDLVQSLFIGPNNLIVEGITDFFILSSISEYLSSIGKISLSKNITITPVGGAQKIPYMVSLLYSEKLNVLVLLDSDKEAIKVKSELIKNRFLKDRQIIFVSDILENTSREADIEDLLDPAVYKNLVRESYAQELQNHKLSINANLPRIAKQFEKAFQKINIEFHKTRPMRLLLEKMRDKPNEIVTPEVADRFSKLNEKINNAMQKIKKK